MAASDGVIRFYRTGDAYGFLSNFSPHPFVLGSRMWPTVEHYFQAQKFAGTPDEEAVRTAPTPLAAAQMGRSRRRRVRSDWLAVRDDVMREAVLAKFTQHGELCEALLATREAELVEHTTYDDYWGDGTDGKGQNRLGEILADVRSELRARGGGCDSGRDAERRA